MSYVKAVTECINAGLPDEDFIVYLPRDYEFAIRKTYYNPTRADRDIMSFCTEINDLLLVAQLTIVTE